MNNITDKKLFQKDFQESDENTMEKQQLDAGHIEDTDK